MYNLPNGYSKISDHKKRPRSDDKGEASVSSSNAEQTSSSTQSLYSQECDDLGDDVGDDLGDYMESLHIKESKKYSLLTCPYVPFKNYDFKKDATGKKRFFQRGWLKVYEWMVYSKKLKGALCKHCVLFSPNVKRGVKGAFVIKELTAYKHLHEAARKHIESEWHRHSILTSMDFIRIAYGNKPTVSELLNNQERDIIEQNRKKLSPIISTILLCGKRDIALRGFSNLGLKVATKL
ncbi:unnamed protein product [Brassicogethes aeneus]|uniref:TTF-type domain-containing protein n=1 Tax=Brassicogethes aeneus TaxID=1431903 RepID=A0A9P0BC54_BRAAE|nr:unnamed protein product [Brassicogethes aeneus]